LFEEDEVKVDVGLWVEPQDTAVQAKEYEDLGYDMMFVPETSHDPFLPVALAASATTRLGLRTGVAVALPRNPLHLAMVANDLQTISKGRFVLGLGSQVKPHIEKRFGSPWIDPIGQMREMVLAIRAIWHSWNSDDQLDFRGEFYNHTLMTPFFSPGPNEYGVPRIQLGAVGPKMAEIAGEVADGVALHGVSSEKFIREVTIPAIERGLARMGRSRDDFELTFPNLIATGDSPEELAENTAILSRHFAFYASTPSYSRVFELHGFSDLQRSLYELTREKRWDDLGKLVTEDVLKVFTVRGTPEEVSERIVTRVGDVADRVSFFSPAPITPSQISRILKGLQAAPGRKEFVALEK
jgi:probable F420-dependent oxidoreductase